jgi:photosystem II stability/assembly factor-like uncharacterized protein
VNALVPATAGLTTQSSNDWQAIGPPAGATGWGIGGSEEAIVASTVNNDAYRSVDNGHTWDPVDAPVEEGEIQFDSTNPDRGYFAGFGGIAGTTDAGAIWELVQDLDRGIAVAVHDDGTVAASVDTGGFEGAIRVSTDAGDTWRTLGWPSTTTLVDGIAFGQTADDIVVVGIGDTWVTHDGGDDFQVSILEGNDGTVAGLAVGPNDPDHAFAAARIDLDDSKV